MNGNENLLRKLENIYLCEERKYCKNVQDYWSKVTPLFASDVSKISLYKYISGRINRLNLHNVDPCDVLLESIIRGIEYITKHQKPIENPEAWLRFTASNVLLEKVKEIKRYYQWSDDLDRIDFDNDREDRESFSEHPGKALQAFRSLSKPEQQIITYRLFQNKKYSEINDIDSYKEYSQITIRQQYHRAIKNLRKIFKQLVPDSLF
jgi:DNA-directed RNA polymerase specialized sigma24 family protein